MTQYEIFVYSAAFIAVVLAILAFIKTSDEQKFGLPKYVKKEGVEYAPEYSPKEKRVLRPTKYVYGWRARLVGALFFIVLISLVGLGVWGYFAANELVLSFESKWPTCPNS
jgi:hypothetical protein